MELTIIEKQSPIPPETPLILITDRSQNDVDNQTTKGSYQAEDLNRVGEAMILLAGILAAQGYIVSVNPKTDWSEEDWPTPNTMTRYLVDLSELRNAVALFAATPPVPSGMDQLTYQTANDIERILEDVDARLRMIATTWFYNGDLYAGEA